MLRKPVEVTVTDIDGLPHTYTLTRFDAILGREVVAKYPMSNLPKLGDYAVSEEIMLKLMSCVGVKSEGAPDGVQFLATRELYKNHVPDWECGAKIERAMMEHNTSFFSKGVVSNFLSGFTPTLTRWILSILTELSAQLSQQTKPPSTN